MKILCTFLARGGSKRVPFKNIRPIDGRPVILHTANEISKSKLVDDIVISSEDHEVRKIILESEFRRSFRDRPNNLALDTTDSISVLKYIIDKEKERDKHYTHVLNIPPTAIMISVDAVKKAIDLSMHNIDSVIISIKSFNVPIRSSYAMDKEGVLKPYSDEDVLRETQANERNVYDCGMFALIPVKYIEMWPDSKSYLSNLMGISIDTPFVDVDEEADWNEMVDNWNMRKFKEEKNSANRSI